MVALVLSGGGPLAVAWEAGLLAGLASEGVLFADAEFVLGTSAGAIVGAQLCAGVDPSAIADPIIAEGQGVRPPGPPPPFNGQAAARLSELFRKAQDPQLDSAAVRREIGAYAAAAQSETEEESLRRFAFVVGRDWPERPLGCVVVDVQTGGVSVLGTDCGAPLNAAVAASCSLPDISPPITIAGCRYFDGGFASAANLDLAIGYKKVAVLAFQRPGPSGPRVAAAVERQAAQLRGNGAEVLVIHPDEACLAAIGSNWIDVRARPTVARTAIDQGAAAAATVTRFIGT